MDLHILAIPYDSARPSVGMGAGPDRLLAAGLTERLRAAGHRVTVERVEPADGAPPAEIRTAFEINRVLSRKVRAVSEGGGLPVVLAGNCNTAVGTLAGLGEASCGVLWFDSHGDLNTPETTAGGFLDGMALAMVTGRCWSRLLAGVPGFRAVPDGNVILLGARALDPPEEALLGESEITVLPPARVRTELPEALAALKARTSNVYVHLDLDSLDPEEGRANALAAPDGLSLDEMRRALARIQADFRVRAVALTAYDPACDPEGRVCRAAFDMLDSLIPSEAGAPAG